MVFLVNLTLYIFYDVIYFAHGMLGQFSTSILSSGFFKG